jgi:hypothetical protein
MPLGRYTTKQGLRYPFLSVAFSQKNPAILKLILKKYPGGYLQEGHLRYEYIRAECLLRILLPYLKVKREVALLGLKHRSFIKTQRKGKGTLKGSPYTLAENRRQISIREKLMRLNKRD